MAVRLSKILFVAAAALFALLAGVNNIVDYGSNFVFVRHVLMMDTVFPDNQSLWRAIEAPWLQHLAYWLIILAELAIGALGAWGALALWRARRDAARFNQCKSRAIQALTLGVMLWFTGFMVVAGEWFMMWQSEHWNAQQAAFRFAVIYLLGLIFISLRD